MIFAWKKHKECELNSDLNVIQKIKFRNLSHVLNRNLMVKKK